MTHIRHPLYLSILQGLTLGDEEIEEMIREADRNNDGQLNHDEFIAAITADDAGAGAAAAIADAVRKA